MNFYPIGGIALLVLPALLIATVPKRWIWAAIGLWTVSPALIFAALELIGKTIGTPAEPRPGSFSDALLLAGSFLLIPWLLICATGFGIGLAIRAWRRKSPQKAPLANPAAPQQMAVAPALQPPTPIFYPVQPVMEGVAADGALRYAHRQGEFVNGRYDSVSLSAVLIDAATGETLVDCAGWASSGIAEQTDGSLFLHLQQNQFESLFRIDGRSGLFRDLGVGADDKPLSALAQAVKTAWLATAQRTSPPQYRHIAPDGAIRVDLASQEWSNSHWVNAPRVIEIAGGRVLLDLWGTDWDATVFFREVGRVRLDCRRYHVGGGLSVVLDVARGCYQITLAPDLGGTLPEQPLSGIAQGLEAASRRGAKDSQAFPSPPHALAAWRPALLILLGALALIAVASALTVRFDSKPVPLTRIPHVPVLGAGTATGRMGTLF
jgi:hypothetical protein